MKNLKDLNFWKVGALLVGFCLLFSTVMVPLLARAAEAGNTASGQTSAQQRTITVSGSADIMVAPDEVDITVGVETRNADFKKARAENDTNVKKVLELAKRFGIESKNVQSDYIRTYPSYKYDQYNETSVISFYNVQKRLVIKLKDISRFDSFISELMNDGGVLIQNIEFRSTEFSKYRNEARKLAVKAAKEKAILLTSGLDSEIGKPVTISEEQLNSNTWYGSWWGSSWYGYGQPVSALSNVTANYQSGPATGAPGQDGETIAIGQIKITAKIGVVFEIK